MNENTKNPIDKRIDDALARRFPIPEDSAAFLPGLTAGAKVATGPKKSSLSVPLVLMLAAAATLLFIMSSWFNGQPGLQQPSIVREVARLPMRMNEPNLATLYYEVSTALDDPFICLSPEGLAKEFAANYDCCEELRVHPKISDLLEGPFDSSQWPSGTIMTGQVGNGTAVLIADLDSTYNCCVRPQLPEESELEVFTMRLGDLVLTEITHLSEPRLLDYFSWGEELR
jgi:hypothetical protein